jgi:hypothetical protein
MVLSVDDITDVPSVENSRLPSVMTLRSSPMYRVWPPPPCPPCVELPTLVPLSREERLNRVVET